MLATAFVDVAVQMYHVWCIYSFHSFANKYIYIVATNGFNSDCGQCRWLQREFLCDTCHVRVMLQDVQFIEKSQQYCDADRYSDEKTMQAYWTWWNKDSTEIRQTHTASILKLIIMKHNYMLENCSLY